MEKIFLFPHCTCGLCYFHRSLGDGNIDFQEIKSDTIHLNRPAIVVNEIDLDFTLHDSGIRQIARALLGPLGKTIFGGYRTLRH